jgi:hypothetical protein
MVGRVEGHIRRIQRQIVDDPRIAFDHPRQSGSGHPYEKRAIVVRGCMSDAGLAVMERHRQAIVRQHLVGNRRDLREYLPDIEYGAERPQQLLGNIRGQGGRGYWLFHVIHDPMDCACRHNLRPPAHALTGQPIRKNQITLSVAIT